MNLGVLIRVAEAGDVEALKFTLGPEHHAFFMDRFRLQGAGLGEILIAFREGEPIGAVFLFWGAADEPEVRRYLADIPMIFHLHVARAHRHRGVGRSLLCRAEEALRDRGHERVLLGVDQSNKLARSLFEWLGYTTPPEPALSNLGADTKPGNGGHPVAEAYDILVADLCRPTPEWPG
jgi:GNAT superfamily N-acetyltransferase